MFFTKVVLNAQQLFLYINMQMAEFYEEVGTCLSVNKRYASRESQFYFLRC